MIYRGVATAQGADEAVAERFGERPRGHQGHQADGGAQQHQAHHLERRPEDGVRRRHRRSADRAQLVAHPRAQLQAGRAAQDRRRVLLGRGVPVRRLARVGEHQADGGGDEDERRRRVGQQQPVDRLAQRQEDGQQQQRQRPAAQQIARRVHAQVHPAGADQQTPDDHDGHACIASHRDSTFHELLILSAEYVSLSS